MIADARIPETRGSKSSEARDAPQRVACGPSGVAAKARAPHRGAAARSGRNPTERTRAVATLACEVRDFYSAVVAHPRWRAPMLTHALVRRCTRPRIAVRVRRHGGASATPVRSRRCLVHRRRPPSGLAGAAPALAPQPAASAVPLRGRVASFAGGDAALHQGGAAVCGGVSFASSCRDSLSGVPCSR